MFDKTAMASGMRRRATFESLIEIQDRYITNVTFTSSSKFGPYQCVINTTRKSKMPFCNKPLTNQDLDPKQYILHIYNSGDDIKDDLISAPNLRRLGMVAPGTSLFAYTP